MEVREERKYTLLGGDFNPRTRREGGTIAEEEEKKSKRGRKKKETFKG